MNTVEQSILVRYDEIHLKGKNRPFFEKKLLSNMKRALQRFDAKITRTQGRYFVEGYQSNDEKEMITILQHVPGIHSISPIHICDKDWDTVCDMAVDMMQEALNARQGNVSFKVNARRSDKQYPLTSTQIAPELGEVILDRVPNTSVDVHHPDVSLGIEIREKAVCYVEIFKGAGGMPVGCNGLATLLLSGGIDSPVAGYMMMKRGLSVDCVHFHSFPYTSERAKEKVIDLTRIMAQYAGAIRLFIVPITDFQLALYEKCPQNEMTILLRRGMMQVAERIALAHESQALITGEALGQVASQTLAGLRCTDQAVELPVFRPCIGFDKLDIIKVSKEIGTYETSIQPYEDCCTIFTPKHPVTNPKLERIIQGQAMLDSWDELLDKAYDETEILWVKAQ